MMLPCSFRVGEVLVIADKAFEIVEVVAKKVHARSVSQGDLNVYDMSDLLKLYETGKLIFSDLLSVERAGGVPPPVQLDRTLADFPKAVQDNALRRLK